MMKIKRITGLEAAIKLARKMLAVERNVPCRVFTTTDENFEPPPVEDGKWTNWVIVYDESEQQTSKEHTTKSKS